MSHNWQMNLALGLALIAHGIGTTATAQTVGPPAPDQGGAESAAGVSQPGLPDADMQNDTVKTAPPAQQRSMAHFGRVGSTRREVVVSPPAAVVGRLGGTAAAAGVAGGGRLHPYSAQAALRAGSRRDPRVPAGSSWQGSGPAASPTVSVRSSSHNYYPGMRPAMGRNANVPPPSRTGGGAFGANAATTMMTRNMILGSQRPVARSTQGTNPGGSSRPGGR